jgi:hypothetical protein
MPPRAALDTQHVVRPRAEIDDRTTFVRRAAMRASSAAVDELFVVGGCARI